MTPADTILPETPADVLGEHGQAWRVDLDRMCGGGAHRAVNISAWIVYAPWAHPIWHSYIINVIALRNATGLPAAMVHRPGATHEIAVYALNPDGRRYSVAETPQILTPANFVGQFVATDDEAMATAERVARAIVYGSLNPDTDAVGQWVNLFGDYCFKDRLH